MSSQHKKPLTKGSNRDEGFTGRNEIEECVPDTGSLIYRPGKYKIFYKNETEVIELGARPGLDSSDSAEASSDFRLDTAGSTAVAATLDLLLTLLAAGFLVSSSPTAGCSKEEVSLVTPEPFSVTALLLPLLWLVLFAGSGTACSDVPSSIVPRNEAFHLTQHLPPNLPTTDTRNMVFRGISF